MKKNTGKARKQAIIIEAIGVISEFGIQAMPTKEIAKRQNISEATIFKYFETKNQLIDAVIDYYARLDPYILSEARAHPDSPFEAIFCFMEKHVEDFEASPGLLAIAGAYDLFLSIPEFSPKIRAILDMRKSFLAEEIEKAKKLGLINSKISGFDLADILMGTFSRVCLEWRMSKGAFSIKERLRFLLNMILDVFKA